jgi:hypothetical protein
MPGRPGGVGDGVSVGCENLGASLPSRPGADGLAYWDDPVARHREHRRHARNLLVAMAVMAVAAIAVHPGLLALVAGLVPLLAVELWAAGRTAPG